MYFNREAKQSKGGFCEGVLTPPPPPPRPPEGGAHQQIEIIKHT